MFDEVEHGIFASSATFFLCFILIALIITSIAVCKHVKALRVKHRVLHLSAVILQVFAHLSVHILLQLGLGYSLATLRRRFLQLFAFEVKEMVVVRVLVFKSTLSCDSLLRWQSIAVKPLHFMHLAVVYHR